MNEYTAPEIIPMDLFEEDPRTVVGVTSSPLPSMPEDW